MPETIERPRGLKIPERRALTALFVEPPEIRASESGDGWTFVGYAAVFDRLSVDLGGFRERVLRGAFKDVLADPDLDITLVADHGMGALTTVASTRGGTLQLSEDSKGLRVEADIAPTTVGGDLRILIERRDVQGMSFGFSVSEGGDSWAREAGELIRTVRKVARLYDVSIVSFPAYTDTGVEIRGLLVERRAALELFDTTTARLDAAEVRRVRERVDARLLELTPEQRAGLDRAVGVLAGSASAEHRETYGDLYAGLDAALADAYPDRWPWIVDFTDDAVVFSAGGTLFEAPYTVAADGPIEIGAPFTVRPQTKYVPTEPAGPEDRAQARDRLGRRLQLMAMEMQL